MKHSHLARLEEIWHLISFATYIEFTVYQTGAKQIFPNGFLKEEESVKQPLGFERSDHPNHAYTFENGMKDRQIPYKLWLHKR